MREQYPVKQCQYCDSADIGIGWQHGDAMVMYKRNGILGSRLRLLICRRCGAVLFQYVAEPQKYQRVQ